MLVKMCEKKFAQSGNLNWNIISLWTADENSAFNVTSTCAYGMTVDKIEQDNKWQEIQSKIAAEDIDKERL